MPFRVFSLSLNCIDVFVRVVIYCVFNLAVFCWWGGGGGTVRRVKKSKCKKGRGRVFCSTP